jgi:hypothetical protein
LAKLAAGGTTAAAAGSPLALADAQGDGEAAGLAAAALPDAAGLPDTAGLPDAEAHVVDPAADWLIVVALPPETARMTPRVRPNAIGMARGTAMRAARLLLPRRRHADRCPLSIQSTSMDVRCDAPGGSR